MTRTKSPDERYAAKLLFQYRVEEGGVSNIMRTCEERIIILKAKSARLALSAAKRRGVDGQHSYKNDGGGVVYFEFVGVMDLLQLGAECDDDEVWYDITKMKTPKERAQSILPPEEELNAIRWSDAIGKR